MGKWARSDLIQEGLWGECVEGRGVQLNPLGEPAVFPSMQCCLRMHGQLMGGSQTEGVHVSVCPFDCDYICMSVSVCM